MSTKPYPSCYPAFALLDGHKVPTFAATVVCDDDGRQVIQWAKSDGGRRGMGGTEDTLEHAFAAAKKNGFPFNRKVVK